MSPETIRAMREAALKSPFHTRLRRLRYRAGLATTSSSLRFARRLPEPLRAPYARAYAQLFRYAFGHIPAIFEHTNPDMAIAFDNAFGEMSRRYVAAVSGKSISELGSSSSEAAAAAMAQTASSGSVRGSNA
jgi:hypothetical protein